MNTALLIEPRKPARLPLVVKNVQEHLGEKWKIVFYCGKGTVDHWKSQLDPSVELRELEVNDLAGYKYNDFLRRKDLWESLEGEFVLTFQADVWLLSIPPYTIDYYLEKNFSYIGGTLSVHWNELLREGYCIPNGTFNGGLSLRKRQDMIRIIEAFPPITSHCTASTSIHSDGEDVYFTLGCLKLGLPLGNDPHFALHGIFVRDVFGVHSPHLEATRIYSLYPEVLQAHMLRLY